MSNHHQTRSARYQRLLAVLIASALFVSGLVVAATPVAPARAATDQISVDAPRADQTFGSGRVVVSGSVSHSRPLSWVRLVLMDRRNHQYLLRSGQWFFFRQSHVATLSPKGANATDFSYEFRTTRDSRFRLTAIAADDRGVISDMHVDFRVDSSSVIAKPVPEDPPTDVPVPGDNAAGWNIYTWRATRSDVIGALNRQRPSLVRWFVEMDRLIEDETKLGRPARNWSWDHPGFQEFFRTVAANNTTLIVALWNKADWAKSMRACAECNYPKIGEYKAFVAELETALDAHGIEVIWEAMNEPDLRWGSLNAVRPGAVVNYTFAWQPVFNPFTGLAAYSGGTGQLWSQMHEAADGPYGSGGIDTTYTNEVPWAQRLFRRVPWNRTSTAWLDATAPLVDVVGLHLYGVSNIENTDIAFDLIYDQWSKWKQAKSGRVPFYLGEIGPTGSGSPGITNESATMLRNLHNRLRTDPRTADEYLGMTAHIVAGANRVSPVDTAKGWWEAGFDAGR